MCQAGGDGCLVTHDRGVPELGMCLRGRRGLSAGERGRRESWWRCGGATVFTVCPPEA